jgi:hypothetical protein
VKPDSVHLSSGGAILQRVLTPAIQLAAIRLALSGLDPPLATFDRWRRYLDDDAQGILTLEVESLVKGVLQRSGRWKERVMVDHQRRLAETAVTKDPFLLVRGHDFIRILHHLLRTTWGRRIAGSNVKAWSEDRLSRFLLLALPADTLDATGLFGSVRAQF